MYGLGLPFWIIRKSIMPLMIAALLATNVLTLFNSKFHDFLFGSLSYLAPVSWVASSTTEKLRAKQLKEQAVKQRTKRIVKRVKKRTARNLTTSLAAVPAEAVPFAGIAAIVTTAALDLNDACEDMKDMDELMSIMDFDSEEDTDKVCGMRVPSKRELKKKIGL